MRKILKFLAMVVVVSAGVAQPVIAVVPVSMDSPLWWYNRIESIRKKGQDHLWVSAVIKGVNLGAGEITIYHGPISHAKMPAMTMTFPVRDPSDLTTHQVGDRIQIQVADDGGVIRIVHIIRSAKRH
jgi:Cu/Ag efflux protein CusF